MDASLAQQYKDIGAPEFVAVMNEIHSASQSLYRPEDMLAKEAETLREKPIALLARVTADGV